MAEMSPRLVVRRGLPFMIGIPLFVFALDFVVLLATSTCAWCKSQRHPA